MGNYVYYEGETPYFHAFKYSNGALQDLGSLTGQNTSYSFAMSINDAGQIVGRSSTQRMNSFDHAFLYSNNTLTDLGTSEPTAQSQANSINNAGQIVGSLTPYNSFSIEPVIFRDGNIINLDSHTSYHGNANAVVINDKYGPNGLGQIIVDGYFNGGSDGTIGAFLYSHGKMKNIGNIACPEDNYSQTATAINDAGQVVGYCAPYQATVGSIFIYDSTTEESFLIANTTTFSKPLDINEAGDVVGTGSNEEGTVFFPLLYTNGVVYNISNFIPSIYSVEGIVPVAINDKGQILANAYQFGTQYVVVLLTPL